MTTCSWLALQISKISVWPFSHTPPHPTASQSTMLASLRRQFKTAAIVAVGAGALYTAAVWPSRGATVSHDGMTYFVPQSRVELGSTAAAGHYAAAVQARPSASAPDAAAPPSPTSTTSAAVVQAGPSAGDAPGRRA